MSFKRILVFIVALLLTAGIVKAQVTTSSMSGSVSSDNVTNLPGATVIAIQESTGTQYKTVTRSGGQYNISNMNPGGPYTITVSFVGYKSSVRSDIYLVLGETSRQDFELSTKSTELTAVNIAGARSGQAKGGTETTISRDRMANLPTVGRNITDFLRSVPQAKLGSTEGSISIAGQNNRYNAFYIDGALNNDVFGLSASGTNGGQANIAPISIDAIDQIQVVISPYDASLSGFTGGGINAVTRSGTNTTTGSVYYLFRNQDLTGKTPTGDKSLATKLPSFQAKTYGLRVGGPIIKNKVFYFLSLEQQRDVRPQTFDTSTYRGNLRPDYILTLRDTFKSRYNYDPGSFIDNPEKVNADRVTAKLDWKLNDNNKFSLAYRYNYGQRFNTASSTASTINFYNDGFVFPTTTNALSAELRSQFNRGASNRLLVTYADIKDDRGILGSPFPRISIFDGANGTIVLGPDNSSTINLLTQKNFNFLDIFKFNVGRHAFSVGTDNELNKVYNAFIQNTYGNYNYANLDSFLQNKTPRTYSVGYPLIDNKTDETTAAAASFKVLRVAGFISDEFRPNDRLTFNFGIRADKTTFLTTPGIDTFTNNVAIPKFSQYYDLHGAMSGQKPGIPISISPRLGITYRIAEEGVTIRGGAGVFTGRIPLVWPGGMYNNNGFFQGGFTASSGANPNALKTIRFRPDPFGQWRAQDVGINLTKGPLNLVSKTFQLPKVFRISLGFDKQLGHGWSTTMETFFTKNITETYYTNINILPPIGVSVGPGSRNVYPAPNTLPITATGTNPYDNAILLSNAKNNTGFSYNYTFTIDKRFQNGLSFTLNYSYGDAMVVHEPTSSVNLSQWRFIETVNGRNFIERSNSDFGPGHRIFAFLSKKFSYLNKSMATTFSLVYTGQSGSPFSYVYQGAAVRDDASGGNDLIYIPTTADLTNQIFLPNTVGSGASATTYSPQQQKDALDAFIQNNKYLRKHRGEFAGRNGDRQPFTNIIDLRIAQDFNLKVSSKRRLQFQVTYDMFNFTNFLNRDWGRTYFISNDQFSLLAFSGYVASTNLTPQYKFNPLLTQPQSQTNVSTSSAPSFSARWSSQLGLRMNF